MHKFKGHRDERLYINRIEALVFSADNKMLASVAWDGTVRIWDLLTGKAKSVLTVAQGWLWCVAFSPDSNHVAAGGERTWASEDSVVRVWHHSSGRCLAEIGEDRGQVKSLAFLPGGSAIVFTTSRGEVGVWAVTPEPKLLNQWTTPKSAVKSSVAPKGTHIACAFTEHIELYQSETGRLITRLDSNSINPENLSFSSDEQVLAAAYKNGVIECWNLKNQTAGLRFSLDREYCQAIAISSKVDLVAAMFFGGLRMYDPNDTSLQSTKHEPGITVVKFSPAGDVLAAGSDGSSAINLWDSSSGELLQRLQHEDTSTSCLQLIFSTNGKLLVSRSKTVVSIWLKTERNIWEPHTTCYGQEGQIHDLVLSHDNEWLASAWEDGTVRVLRMHAPWKSSILCTRERRINIVRFSPDGRCLASASRDSNVSVWELSDNNEYSLVSEFDDGYAVHALAFSPSNDTLAFDLGQNSVMLWNFRTEESQILNGSGTVMSLCFSPDGRFLATAPLDSSIIIWDLDTSTQVTRMELGGIFRAVVTFEHGGACLRLNHGLVSVRDFAVKDMPLIHIPSTAHALCLDSRNDWILDGKERILKIPISRSSASVDVLEDQIAIGDGDGLVSMFYIRTGEKNV
jgi:WD40 repeat protein